MPNPIVIIVAEKLQVLFYYLDRGVPHFIFRDAGIDPDVVKRVVKTVEMFVEFEDTVSEGTGHVKHGIAVLETAIPEGNHGMAFRHDLTVEVRYAFVLTRRRHLMKPFE